MGKKKKKRKKGQPRISLAIVAPIIGNIVSPAPSGRTMLGDLMAGDWPSLVFDFAEKFGGIGSDGKLHIDWLVATYGPIAVGAVVHKYVGGAPLNLNKKLAQAGIPFISI